MFLVFLSASAIGFVAGLRSMTAPAVVAWAAYLGWIDVQGSPLAFMGSIMAVAIFSLFAIGELIGDKLPIIPKRTDLMPLLARIVTGALCGASLYLATHHSLGAGALIGGIAAVIGAFAGYHLRAKLVNGLHIKDVLVALVEDLLAIGLALFFVSRG